MSTKKKVANAALTSYINTTLTTCTFFPCAILKHEMSVSFLVFQASCVKTEPGEPGDGKPNLRRRMGSFVVKPEPGQAAKGLFYDIYSHSLHPAL